MSTKDQDSENAAGQRSVLTQPAADRFFIIAGIPLVMALIGLALPPLARWILGIFGGLPMRPVFRLFASIDSPLEIAINLVIWLIAGALLALAAWSDSAQVTVTDADLRVSRGKQREQFARRDISAVFVDDKALVVLDHESRHLFRGPLAAGPNDAAAAFRSHGYPWQNEDPYAHLYRRWVPDLPDLPPAVNALLAARETALKKRAGPEVHDLSVSVEKLGYAVRDEGQKQFWRSLIGS